MVLARRAQIVGNLLWKTVQHYGFKKMNDVNYNNKNFCQWYLTASELPKKLNKCERKPLVRSINELKREARERKKDRQKVHEIVLQPPQNGMLLEQLVPVAHKVYAARLELFSIVSRLVNHIAIYSCR